MLEEKDTLPSAEQQLGWNGSFERAPLRLVWAAESYLQACVCCKNAHTRRTMMTVTTLSALGKSHFDY